MNESQNPRGSHAPEGPRLADDGGRAASTDDPGETADAPGPRRTRTGLEAARAVRGVVLSIPRAKVLSYGDVAELAELNTPRLAARVMALGQAGADVPWWRVVRADGTLPDRLQVSAREHYEREGTPLRKTAAHWVQVDVRRARWVGSADDAPAPGTPT